MSSITQEIPKNSTLLVDCRRSLSDTIDTLASHRIDEVVRVLTIITLLTVPLTVLSTVFGMNVRLPYDSHPLLFYLINVVGMILTVVVIWYLRHRHWL